MIIELYDKLKIAKNKIYNKLYKKGDIIVLEKEKYDISSVDKEEKEFLNIIDILNSFENKIEYKILKAQIQISVN